jgi:hypothetical protein
MTQNEIIELAIKCGWDNPATNMTPLYEFAKLVAEKEREECALIADQISNNTSIHVLEKYSASEIAKSIRARGYV